MFLTYECSNKGRIKAAVVWPIYQWPNTYITCKSTGKGMEINCFWRY